MGCCCSCLDGDGESAKEAEMTSKLSSQAKGMKISRAMSAPTIEIEEGVKISGDGLGVAGVNIEQDSAYWEWHIDASDGSGKAEDTKFGVTTKKDQKFYRSLEEQDDVSPQTDGTALMKKVPICDGDTIGVAVQQSDLPMVQFLVNGEPQHNLAINRFRGNVYPSIFLAPGENVKAKLVLDENEFLQEAPNARFGPIILARGII
mmetsp:Transcript_24833/g.37747  ORF Transcript_24833/g.37747 Transcript_24833/m.37747 type:complete len:204 (+) Transcript_24833:135-746(+)|eukprot:CAMPEP_0178919410 /NCGR_PEP_ID=MMETSP0786-20121207/14419_1 /TAXON_ID=186022 /ORGANISM="Thalassionema frauenfeldii, Strain CCMP 1798" /LENGTH=203 /DNA_ID=CAMNT_0020593333 /DNA_START=86 /DNA_END=697 /DNA_ORIENTATION=-